MSRLYSMVDLAQLRQVEELLKVHTLEKPQNVDFRQSFRPYQTTHKY